MITILSTQVDKSKKSSRPQSPTTTNYTNLDFANSLTLYENSRDVLSRLHGPPPLRAQEASRRPTQEQQRQEYRNPDPSLPVSSPIRRQTVGGGGAPPSTLVLNSTTENYLDMSPSRREVAGVTDYELMQFRQRRSSEVMSNGESPLIGFSPVNPLCESVESMVLMCDSKFNTIKQMPKNGVNKAEEDSGLMSRSCHGNIPSSSSQEEAPPPPTSPLLLNIIPNSAFCSGYVTIPRSR